MSVRSTAWGLYDAGGDWVDQDELRILQQDVSPTSVQPPENSSDAVPSGDGEFSRIYRKPKSEWNIEDRKKKKKHFYATPENNNKFRKVELKDEEITKSIYIE